MILEFKCSNYRSIGDEIFFSLLATSDCSLNENLISVGDKNFLKEAIIYGANGSGKSNFVKAIISLKQYVVNSVRKQPGDSIRVDKNKLLSGKPVSYFIQFLVNNRRYAYKLSLDSDGVKEEYLYEFPNNRKALVFNRVNDEVEFGTAYKTDLSMVQNQFLQSNRLMLSCGANYSNVPQLKEAFTFFNTDLVIYTENPSWRMYSTEMLEKSDELRNSFVEFMKTLGHKSIVGVESKMEIQKVNEDALPFFFSAEIKKEISEHSQKIPNIKLIYEKFFIDLNEESLGVQKLFDIYAPFIDIIRNNKVLLIDEFDAHLHPLIVNKLIKLFASSKSSSQLIFTSHDINLLDLSLFRRDQIWFTYIENENRFTELFSLAEVKAVRKGENISKNYLLGKYKGIPVIDDTVKIDLLGD